MKKNKILIYMCLVLSVFSIFKSQASDFITQEQVDHIFKKEINPPYSCRDRIRQTITQAKMNLDEKVPSSLLKFIFDCRDNHFWLTDYSEKEAYLDFFQSEDSFEDYLGNHWRDDATLKNCWLYYYIEAAKFFLELGNFTESEKNLVNASEINLNQLLGILRSIVAKAFQDKCQSQEISKDNNKSQYYSMDPNFVLKKYATLYENVRLLQSEEFDSIDYITLSMTCLYGHDYEKGIGFGLKALEGQWPSRENPLFRLRCERHLLQRAIARAYYELKQFDDAEKLYTAVPQNFWEIPDHKTIACMSGMQKDWKKCFSNFIVFQELYIRASFSQSWLFVMDEEEALVLMKMFMNRPSKDFQRYGVSFINILKGSIPPLEKDIKLLMSHIKQKKEAESSKLIRQAIAQQHLERMNSTYQSFDQQYQNLWAHGSLLLSEIREEYLNSLNEIAQKIEKEYSLLMSLKAKGAYADNVGDILEFSRSLEKSFGLFSSQVKEMNHEISRMRRQFYQKSLQSAAQEQGGFHEFKPAIFPDSRSIKAQILADQKKKESEDKIKAKEVISKKQMRQENRKDLKQDYEEKSQKEIPIKKDDISIAPLEQSSLCSFKDKDLEYLWKQGREQLPENVLELLGAIHKAKSIFELRTYLKPGTALEILKGDRKGQISLRNNDQYRLCFYWISGEGAYQIELIDYHH